MKANPCLIAIAAAIAMASSTPAQLFTFDQRLWVYPNPFDAAFLSGTVTVDSVAHTAALDGNFTVPALVHHQNFAQTTIIPGPFPHVDVYRDTLEITYTISTFDQDFSSPAIVPTSIGGFRYRAAFPADVFETQVDFTYVYQENGVTLDVGSGSYPIRGTTFPVVFDVKDYPTAIGMTFEDFYLSPLAVVPIIQIDPPHGPDMRVNSSGICVTGVPEPTTWAIVSGLGLLAFALVRRRLGGSLCDQGV